MLIKSVFERRLKGLYRIHPYSQTCSCYIVINNLEADGLSLLTQGSHFVTDTSCPENDFFFLSPNPIPFDPFAFSIKG